MCLDSKIDTFYATDDSYNNTESFESEVCDTCGETLQEIGDSGEVWNYDNIEERVCNVCTYQSKVADNESISFFVNPTPSVTPNHLPTKSFIEMGNDIVAITGNDKTYGIWTELDFGFDDQYNLTVSDNSISAVIFEKEGSENVDFRIEGTGVNLGFKDCSKQTAITILIATFKQYSHHEFCAKKEAASLPQAIATAA